MATRILHKSFVGGVLSHDMFSRVDDAKYNDGAELLDNFIIKPQGLVQNRAGTYFIREVKYSNKYTRLLSFVYSSKQAVIIEFGEFYFRFHINRKTKLDTNGNIYEIVHSYKESELLEVNFSQSGNILTLVHGNHKPSELERLANATWTFKASNFQSTIVSPTNVSITPTTPSTAQADSKEDMFYVVVAVDNDEIRESPPSEEKSASNNIYANGASNLIKWTASTSATVARYNVYKKRGGIYGFIGSTTGLELTDNNIAPDMSITPAMFRDTDFSTGAGSYPHSVSHLNQRRIFAGTNNNPATIWLTRTATESDLSYSIPTQATDRIKLKLSANTLTVIRHAVPLKGLVVLTDTSEWLVSVDADKLDAVLQSYIGASIVQPVVVGNYIVYLSARGNFLRAMGYDWQAQGFATESLSIRASHLFDTTQAIDLNYSKFPEQLIWVVLDNGKLVSLSFLPDQKVNAFSQQITDGKFESCAVIPEQNEDYLYVVVKRNIDGVEKRYIERMEDRSEKKHQRDYFFVDCGLTYSGFSDKKTTVKITSDNNLWNEKALVTITASTPIFVNMKDEVSAIIIGNNRFIISGYVSDTSVKAYPEYLKIEKEIQEKETIDWEIQRTKFKGLEHLKNKTVSILADGAEQSQVKVSETGEITIARPATVVHAGLPYKSRLKTLPLLVEGEALGRGKTKNISKAWVRVLRTSGFWVGGNFENLTEVSYRKLEKYSNPQKLKTELIEVNVRPSWGYGGQICIEQTAPLPLAISGITTEVSLGGSNG